MAARKKNILENQNGQSIIEFLLFLPFMLMMYSVTMSISNSINASINQQKIARSYWHYINMNNSTIPAPLRGGAEPSNSWQVFGSSIVGWSEELFEGRIPLAPCFKFVIPLGEGADDSCEESYSGTSTQFIRIQTVYGICGATYIKSDGYNNAYPRGAATSATGNVQHCIITE